MIPKQDIVLSEEFELDEQTSRTYRMELEQDSISDYCDELRAVEQAIYKILEVVSNNNYTFEVLGEANIVTGICLVGYFELSDNFKEGILLEGNANVGTGLNDLYINTFTDGSKEEHILKGDLYAKGATVGIVECSIIDNI